MVYRVTLHDGSRHARYRVILLLPTLILLATHSCDGIVAFMMTQSNLLHQNIYRQPITSKLFAKPQRLANNVDGVVYVNDRCINCAACAGFASNIFHKDQSHHIVHHQPRNIEDIYQTRAALSACPVAAIRIESIAERKHTAAIMASKDIKNYGNDIDPVVTWTDIDQWIVQQMTSKDLPRPFPRPFLKDESLSAQTDQRNDFSVPGVYWVGHHNEHSFGAIPYLVSAQYDNEPIWIMIDSPKFNQQSVKDVISITGPNGPHYMVLTHVDDTADHNEWANQFPDCQRIFHAGDLGKHNWLGDTSLEDVPILLQVPNDAKTSNILTAYTMDGKILNDDWVEQFENDEMNSDVVILHTPGHSPGSICLYKRRTTSSPGILFTGDTYAYSGNKMTGFGRYGNNAKEQVHTLSLLMKLKMWDIVAPGHGLSRDYRNVNRAIMEDEMKVAQQDLLAPRYAYQD